MYNRKTKGDKPVLAVCYDFDKTLSPDDMQAQGYIQKVYDGDVASFWAECNRLSAEADMDSNLAYMYKMRGLRLKSCPLSRGRGLVRAHTPIR